MIEIAISLLSLSAGIYLLAYVKQNGLGSLYKYLSWLVVLLSLGFILCGVARFAMHKRHAHQCMEQGHCRMKENCCQHAEMGSCHENAEKPACCAEGKSCCKAKMSCCEKGGEAEEGKTCGADKEGKMPCCHKAAADSSAKK